MAMHDADGPSWDVINMLAHCYFGHLDDNGLAVGGVADPDVAEQRAGGVHAEGGSRQAGAFRERILQWGERCGLGFTGLGCGRLHTPPTTNGA